MAVNESRPNETNTLIEGPWALKAVMAGRQPPRAYPLGLTRERCAFIPVSLRMTQMVQYSFSSLPVRQPCSKPSTGIVPVAWAAAFVASAFFGPVIRISSRPRRTGLPDSSL